MKEARIIKYKVKSEIDLILTPCKYYNDGRMVGSFICMRCKFFMMKDLENKKVLCLAGFDK